MSSLRFRHNFTGGFFPSTPPIFRNVDWTARCKISDYSLHSLSLLFFFIFREILARLKRTERNESRESSSNYRLLVITSAGGETSKQRSCEYSINDVFAAAANADP